MYQENQQLKSAITQLQAELEVFRLNEAAKTDLYINQSPLRTELETMRKEQEDLLMLLTDQDAKIKKYSTMLRNLGHVVCMTTWQDHLNMLIRKHTFLL